jgi:hypothetical protein
VRIIRTISLLCIAVGLLGPLVVAAGYVFPASTDRTSVLFFGGKGYLPEKDPLSRAEITPAFQRALTKDREPWRVIFACAVTGSVGFLVHLVARSKPSRCHGE